MENITREEVKKCFGLCDALNALEENTDGLLKILLDLAASADPLMTPEFAGTFNADVNKIGDIVQRELDRVKTSSIGKRVMTANLRVCAA